MLRRGFFSQAVSSLRGSVLDNLAKTLPVKEREALAVRWGLISQTPQQQQQPSAPIATAPPPPSIPATSVVDVLARSTEQVYRDRELLHPVFGELVTDLGYKRVYLTNVRSLASAPVWEKNRILRPDRAKKIAAAKVSEKATSGLPGVITCFSEANSDRCGIVDGQHRAAALVLMCNSGHWDELKRNVLVDVFEVSTEQQVSTLFREINSGEPVKLIDMPDEGASDEVRAMLTHVTDSLQRSYADMFKPTSRCRVPHLHADTFRDDLFQADFIKKRAIRSADALLLAIEAENSKLGQRSDADWLARKVSASAISKCRDHKFYLGLDSSWMTS